MEEPREEPAEREDDEELLEDGPAPSGEPEAAPEPRPGVTAPLDHVAEDEKHLGGGGILPGAGTSPDDGNPGDGVSDSDRPEE